MPFDVQVRLSMAKQIHHSNDRQKLIAPELFSENIYDEKVDVYSFGVIVYYILMKGECQKVSVTKSSRMKNNRILCASMNFQEI